jgi:hypothetical protein
MVQETSTEVHPPAAPPPPGGPLAVEIALVLDDTVIGVTHLSPSPGRTGLATRLLALGAALGLGLFVAQSAVAVGVAGENRRALRAWLEDGEAAIDFRPRTLHPLADLAAGVALASGLGLGVWAYARAGRERRRAEHRVGEHVLVDFAGGAPRLSPAPGMSGELTVGGEARPFVAGPLPRGGRARVASGPTTILISTVAPPRAAAGIAARVDRRTLGYATASLAAHAALVLLFFLIPADASGYAHDELGAARRRVSIQLRPAEDPRLRPGARGEQGGDARPAGQAGAPEGSAEPRRRKVRRTAEEPSLPRPAEPGAPRGAGILGVLDARRAELAALAAMTDLASGLDEEDLRGGFLGEAPGDSRGWGTGPIGAGPGAGFVPGTIGVGPPGTMPYGLLRLPPGGLPPRRPKPTFVLGTPSIPEGIDKNLIRRYVRQKHGQIGHCYERELAARPGLAGTATTSFTIDQNGRVIEARARGLGAPAVERCVEDVLRSIAFPRGGIINVTSYPFTFHPVGGG